LSRQPDFELLDCEPDPEVMSLIEAELPEVLERATADMKRTNCLSQAVVGEMLTKLKSLAEG
jgi:hypothetical protein